MSIFAFIIKRFFSGIITLFLLASIVFFLIRLMPGSPFQSNAISSNTLQTLEEQYQLNAPIGIQYKTFLGNLFHGDFGVSYKKPSMTVNAIIAQAGPNTMKLGLCAVFVSFVMGISMGVLWATTNNKFVQGFLSIVTALSIGIPNFAIALFLLIVLGVYLQWFPIIGLSSAMHYVLPVLALSLYPIAVIAKMMRVSYEEAMQQDCVMMARAKGLSSAMVAVRYTLKQAMVPVVSMMGPIVSFLLTGSFVVESIFSIPGLGMEFVHSINNRDYTVILGLVVFMGAVVIVVNMITDIVCSFLDSRMAVLQS